MISMDSNEQEIILSGELTIHTIKELEKKLDKYLDKSFKNISLNLEKVSTLDTSGLQILLAFKKAAEKKGIVKISKVTPKTSKILRIAGLENNFKGR